MNREARLLCVWLTATVIASTAACAHKPAYSDMDANKNSGNQTQNQPAEGQAASTSPPAERPAAEAPSPAPAAPAPPAALKNPSFMDQSKGEIKDLPTYPRAYRVNLQVGAMQGVNTMALALRSNDSMDKITAFYEQVIKANKWTVTDKIIDPEFSEWNLKKGEANSAKVQVKKDPKTTTMNIVVVRGEKMEEPGK